MNSYIFLALIAGAMLPLQAVINARLALRLDSPVWAAAISGAVTTVTLIILGLTISRGIPRSEGSSALPAWVWAGGLCGAVALTAMTSAAPRLGAASMIALVVTGQVLFSLIIDKYGLFGAVVYPLTLQRVIATLLLLAGAFLFIKRSGA